MGELAEATGLTVRTLHYYEQIGLLTPSGRSPAGHRIYDDADEARLYRVGLLRRLGMNLAEVQRALDDPAWDLTTALEAHLAALDARLDATARLRSKVAGALAAGGHRPRRRPRGADDARTPCAAAHHAARLRRHRRGPRMAGRAVRAAAGRGRPRRGRAGGARRGARRRRRDLVAPRAGRVPAGLAEHGRCDHRIGRRAGGRRGRAPPRSVEAGVDVRQQPVDQDYGYRVYSAYDLEGHLWSFMRPLD